MFYGEAYVTLSCLLGNYPLMISTNQNIIYIANIKCQINESIFSKNKRVNLNRKVTFNNFHFYLIILRCSILINLHYKTYNK